MSNSVFTLVNSQNGNLAFKIFSFEDNSHFDHIQRNNYYSILLLLSGKGQLKSDFSEYEIESPVLLCFSPYQPFMLSTKGKIEGITINFHPDFFCIHKHQKEVACNGVLFNNIYNPPFVTLGEADIQKFITLVNDMKVEIQSNKMAQYELLISYLKVFLISASRLKISQSELATEIFSNSKEPFILQNLQDAIEQHYKSFHSPSEYARLMSIEVQSLSKITKLYFNKTLTDLIAERIIIEAKRELYLTSKAIKQIAHELGFNDEFYFSRFFKKNVEISPQLYRDTVGFAKAE